MAYVYVILFLFGFVSSNNYKVGLILNSERTQISPAVQRITEFTLSTFDNSTEVTLVTKEYSPIYTSLYDTICALLEENVVALVSVSDSATTAIEADIASQYHVPLIAAVATDPYIKTADRDYLITISPSDKYQSQLIFELLNHFNWLQFSILASADSYGMNGVVYLQYLATRDSSFNILDVQHFEVHRNPGKLNVTKELELIKSSLTRIIVLNCRGDYAKVIFREAAAMGLMGEGFVWIVTDATTGQPETLSYNGSFPSYYEGIIGTMPCLGEGTPLYNAFKDKYITEHGGSTTDLMMSSVMASDGITAIHQALSNLDGTNWNSVPKVSCSSTDVWEDGDLLFNSIINESFHGIPGELAFNKNGVITTPKYDLMNFVKDSFKKVGNWTNSAGLHLMESNIVYLGGGSTAPSGFSSTLSGFHLRVGIVAEPPIAYKYDFCVNDTTSPECWYGWNPDIIQRLSEDLNFTYEYVQPEDLKYGGFNEETQLWNGMVKDIIDKKTDMTIALSINTDRSAYIDFTLSFFENQASFVLTAVRSTNAANMFFFLLPFKWTVWLSLIGMIVVIGFFVTVLSKLSPFGTYGRQMHALQICPCKECSGKREIKLRAKCRFVDTKVFGCIVEAVEEEDPLDDMSFYNSLWTVSTGLVQQGGEALPHAPSGRLLLVFWWLFVMIMISMYTANLAAYLTLEASTISIKSLTDLLEQHEYEWGVIADRNLEMMMKHHQDTKYTELVARGTKLHSLEEGIEKVHAGGFVFIDEGSVLSFNFMDDCSAVQTATDLFSNEWAFGMQSNSPYEDLINQMFLLYREEGWLTDKWDEWYKSETSCKTEVGGDGMTFDIPILSGLYCIFAIGLVSSIVLVILETFYAAYVDSKRSIEEGVWTCLKRRLKLKKKEMIEEWLGKKINPQEEDTIADLSSSFGGGGLKKLSKRKRRAVSVV